MSDFIFGTLATEALRLEHTRALRAGVTHRQARTPRDPLPGQPVEVELTVGPAVQCQRAWVYWSSDGQDPQGAGGQAVHGQAAALRLVGVEWDTVLWGYVQRLRGVIPGQPEGAVTRYRLSVQAANGEEVFADQGAFYAFYAADDPLPEWTRRAVLYEIFVDRFAPGRGRAWQTPATPAGFYGGTLLGIAENLDHVVSLGADTLWLTPIFASPSHHGYDATDLFEIEPRLGTKADLRVLLDAAHARGLRVLLDFVPNHWSHQHATFQAAQNDPASPYLDWYRFMRWPAEYETFFGVKELPQLNLRHPEARQHMLDAAAYWLAFGVDGFRVDYAIGPPPDFWADFRKVTRAVKPDCWVFGEVVEPSDSQLTFAGLLDGCLDFILLEGIRQTFAYAQWDAARFVDFLERHERFFPSDFSRPSFLDNHDMNRFLWAAGNDVRRLKLAALCQFILPGPPVIYYGTEVGLSQERDVRQDGHGLPEESRLPMLWGADQDQNLLAFYRQLIELRRAAPALPGGERQVYRAEGNLLVYGLYNPASPAAGRPGELPPDWLVAFNLAEQPATVSLPQGEYTLALSTDAGCRLAGALELSPLGGAVLRRLED